MGMLIVILPVPSGGTEIVGVKTRTGNTTEPAPSEPMVNELKVAATTMAGVIMGAKRAAKSEFVEIENVPVATAAVPSFKPDSVMVTAVVPVGWPPIVSTSLVDVVPATLPSFVPVIPGTLDAVPSKDGPVVLTK